MLLSPVAGLQNDWRTVDWAKALIDPVKDEITYIHNDFNVVVVTKFSAPDYVEFLKEEFPLDKMQHIKVVVRK